MRLTVTSAISSLLMALRRPLSSSAVAALFRSRLHEERQAPPRQFSQSTSCRSCWLVLSGLGWLRLPRSTWQGFPRSVLSFQLFRHHRDQHLLLPTNAPRPRRNVDRSRRHKSRLPLYRKTMATIHPRTQRLRRGRTRRTRRVRRSPTSRQARRHTSSVPFLFPQHH